MVTINFRLSEIGKVEISLDGPEDWETLFERCAARSGFAMGGTLAIRRGTLLQPLDLIEEGDEIEVFPALSGG